MKRSELLGIILFVFSVQLILADQIIEPQNFGPPYFYPTNPAERLYKLPWTSGKTIKTWDGYGSEPNTSHHPDYSVDFGMSLGEPICAARGGRVFGITKTESICNVPGHIGNYVLIGNQDSMPDETQPNGWRKVWVKDLYYHIDSSIPVKVNQSVLQGQIIGYANCTGSDGGSPHLHFRTFVDSIRGVWRHLGWFSSVPTYKFASIPTPFVEITNRPNGLPEDGDFYTSQNEPPTSTEEDTHEISRGTRSLLFTVRPNPCRGLTQFAVLLPEAATATLCIYNMNGALIHTASERQFSSHQLQTVEWDAQNAPVGVFVAVLKTKKQSYSLRLTHLK